VIVLGVREDIFRKGVVPEVLKGEPGIDVKKVIGLPRLRSGISRRDMKDHTKEDWKNVVTSFPVDELGSEIIRLAGKRVLSTVKEMLKKISLPEDDLGADYVNNAPSVIHEQHLDRWYLDKRIGGTLNHSARTHMISDLYRYLYVSCFVKVKKRSPCMDEIPERLKPDHKNRDTGDFRVRFRVQSPEGPGHTVTSHISKDGHDNIHPDPRQCRSFTVREAARLQTFPDNYYFCGGRTDQYIQVGNAVPPLLANKIALVVKKLIKEAFEEIG
jgi:DNA (cytosine-5)-methyltransferase 1